MEFKELFLFFLCVLSGRFFSTSKPNTEERMDVSPAAGKPATPEMLVNVPELITAYFTRTPDLKVPEQRVAFGTSGHRGSSLKQAFNEQHILAITQAICQYRREHK